MIAKAIFAEQKDCAFVDGWRQKLGGDTNPYRKDALDFADLAIQRYFADSRIGQPYVRSISDISDHVSHDPQCEAAGFVLLKCNWFPDSEVIGICHFRRTWCNNLVLDYLAGHPFAVRPPEGYKYLVRGVGPALMCFLSRVAATLECGLIWGEATQISHKFYERTFEINPVKDLIIVPQVNFLKCAKLDLSWKTTKDGTTMKSETVEEIYKSEETSPPLVGNRTLVMGPRRQLVDHFFDLPRHVQDEIARALGLLKEGDSEILEDQWCGVLFRRADQSGKLRDLWNEVEKRHNSGEPEKNPFVS